MAYRPVTLIILDGWGITDDNSSSAMARAEIPFFRSLVARFPNTALLTSGEDVGLPEGQMGNSEVGHLNIGAGRIINQDYTRINLAIRDGSFFKNPKLITAMDRARKSGGALHLMGLVSDGGVHSDIKHLYALIRMAADRKVGKVWVHAFLDGRDTPPRSGLGYINDLERFIAEGGYSSMAGIGSVSGRYYAMDRDNRWDRVKLVYDALVHMEGRYNKSAAGAVEYGYEHGETDEFIVPTVITGKARDDCRIKDGDSVISFNFRTDRPREITRALAMDEFAHFDRNGRPETASFVCMTEYDETFGLDVAFPPQRHGKIFGEVVSEHGLRQLRIAETEKYAHVTFFFNGGEEEPFKGEDRCLIPSPRNVATYDHKPEMSAFEVTDEVLRRIASGEYDVIIMNFANPDMVGHTGVMYAAVKACEAVDRCLSRIVPAVDEAGGVAVVTADHGNAEKMEDEESGGAHTAHTSNLVPFIIAKEGFELRDNGRLADIAPTLLEVMGIEKPAEMTGKSLIVR